jgi:hypothetical protein
MGRTPRRGGFTLYDVVNYLKWRGWANPGTKQVRSLLAAAGVALRKEDPGTLIQNYDPLTPEEAQRVLREWFRRRGRRI